jgi:hypothetical protein
MAVKELAQERSARTLNLGYQCQRRLHLNDILGIELTIIIKIDNALVTFNFNPIDP